MTLRALACMLLLGCGAGAHETLSGPGPGVERQDGGMGPTEGRCAELDETACAEDARCHARLGFRHEEDGTCTANVFAGCLVGDGICGGAWVVAVAPDGTCWEFDDTCLPEGFTRGDSSADCGPKSCLD